MAGSAEEGQHPPAAVAPAVEQADPEKYELVKEAYRTLADPKRRELYDNLRRDHLSPDDEDSPEVAEAIEMPASSGAMVPVKASRDQKATVDSIKVQHTATHADVKLQKKLREGVMSALYDIVVTRPRNPELGRAEIARAMDLTYEVMSEYMALIGNRVAPTALVQNALFYRRPEDFFLLEGGQVKGW